MNDLLLMAIAHALLADLYRGEGSTIDDLKEFRFNRAQADRYIRDWQKEAMEKLLTREAQGLTQSNE